MDHSTATLTAEDLDLGSLENDSEPMDVLDLPQLYMRPSAKSLLETLADLRSEPTSWEATPTLGTPRTPLSGASTPFRRRIKVREEGLPRYLTKIVSSPLAWIEDEEDKEKVWEAASHRISERSGRTAMGNIDRDFYIPLHARPKALASTHSPPATTRAHAAVHELAYEDSNFLHLILHEPALVSDNLGLKTWASSYLLAKRLSLLRHSLPPLPPGAAVLELGAGTGLVGLAAAAIFRTHVTLTDLPEIVPNLQRNADMNAARIAVHDARTSIAVLDWSNPASFRPDPALFRTDSRPDSVVSEGFALILAADAVYGIEHPPLLVQTIEHHLSRKAEARVVVESPLREGFDAEIVDFRERMTALGLVVAGEGEETGFDDWSASGGEELAEVRCWWAVWRWK